MPCAGRGRARLVELSDRGGGGMPESPYPGAGGAAGGVTDAAASFAQVLRVPQTKPERDEPTRWELGYPY